MMNPYEILFLINSHPNEFILGYTEGLGGVGMTYDNDPTSNRSSAYDLGRALRQGHSVDADIAPPQGIARPDMSGPERNALASETATQVGCPYCLQPPGCACVTSSHNEASFTHMQRIHARLEQMGRAVRPEWLYST